MELLIGDGFPVACSKEIGEVWIFWFDTDKGDVLFASKLLECLETLEKGGRITRARTVWAIQARIERAMFENCQKFPTVALLAKRGAIEGFLKRLPGG